MTCLGSCHTRRATERHRDLEEGRELVSSRDPITLDQDPGAGDQHGPVLALGAVQVGVSAERPDAAPAVADAIIAPQLAEPVTGEGPPHLKVAHEVKRR
jgi:hypothetical protein